MYETAVSRLLAGVFCEIFDELLKSELGCMAIFLGYHLIS